MAFLTGWSSLESFLLSTTPVSSFSCSVPGLIDAFKLPCAFGVEVKLTQNELVYYLPTISAISLPDFEYIETNPPYQRPSAYEKLQELNIINDPDHESWMALLWIPINKLPPGKAYGSILVYYNLYPENKGYLKLHGLVLFRIPKQWTDVYINDTEVNYEKTAYWNKIREKLLTKAKGFQKSLKTLHHDFNYIVTREGR
jgi:hypothetical protein